jgi:hypothetical protein
MWGSKSAAVSSFRPLPSKEKILTGIAMVARFSQAMVFGFSSSNKNVCAVLCFVFEHRVQADLLSLVGQIFYACNSRLAIKVTGKHPGTHTRSDKSSITTSRSLSHLKSLLIEDRRYPNGLTAFYTYVCDSSSCYLPTYNLQHPRTQASSSS